jgi:two-component system KDP operon response regulator KdpE
MGELLARLRAALRRSGPSGEPELDVGPIHIDLDQQRVTVDGRDVHLTPHEYRILRLLALNPGKLLTHRTSLQEVWGPAYGAESNYLHVYVSQLRRKLEPDPSRPQYIVTEPGAGYRLIAS